MRFLLVALRAAAEPTRLRVLALLAAAELTVSDLTQILGQSQPRLSRHLKLLNEAGLVERHREGRWAFFRLATDGPSAAVARALIDLIPADDPAASLDGRRMDSIMTARSEAASRYFRDNAARWNQIRSLYVDEAEVEHVLSDLVPGGAVGDLLDIGTGTGRILEILGPRAARAVGIDLSREMLALARVNLRAAGLAHCQVRLADMYRLPWPDGSFDLASIHQVLHFAEAPAKVVAEAARVLRPGGRLILVDFAPHSLDFLGREHAHRRLGFADEEITMWARRASLKPARPIALPGHDLTVKVWVADRPASAAPRAADRPALARAVS